MPLSASPSSSSICKNRARLESSRSNPASRVASWLGVINVAHAACPRLTPPIANETSLPVSQVNHPLTPLVPDCAPELNASPETLRSLNTPFCTGGGGGGGGGTLLAPPASFPPPPPQAATNKTPHKIMCGRNDSICALPYAMTVAFAALNQTRG